jgi:hypothetical protein
MLGTQTVSSFLGQKGRPFELEVATGHSVMAS